MAAFFGWLGFSRGEAEFAAMARLLSVGLGLAAVGAVAYAHFLDRS